MSSVLTVQDKVKNILKHNPNARSDDLTLIMLYWNYYEKSQLNAVENSVSRLYRVHSLQHLNLKKSKLTAPTSIIRARAYLQNTLGLYTADAKTQLEREGKAEVMSESYTGEVA